MAREPQAVEAEPQSRAAAFWDARLNVQTTVALFWAGLVLLLTLIAFLPKDVTDNRWFTLSLKGVFNVLVALWVAADARAHHFEEETVKWYMHLSIVLTEFTVPVYLVRSRGWGGALRACLWFLGRLLLATMLIVAVMSISEGLGIRVSS